MGWQWHQLDHTQIISTLLPLPSNRHHRSNGDCLEGKRENYQIYLFCAILCATIVHSAMHTHEQT